MPICKKVLKKCILFQIFRNFIRYRFYKYYLNLFITWAEIRGLNKSKEGTSTALDWVYFVRREESTKYYFLLSFNYLRYEKSIIYELHYIYLFKYLIVALKLEPVLCV